MLDSLLAALNHGLKVIEFKVIIVEPLHELNQFIAGTKIIDILDVFQSA